MIKTSLDRLRARPDEEGHFDLERLDPRSTPGFKGDSKEKGRAALAKEKDLLASLQPVLYAGAEKALLVVFQAMDTGGKDGVVRNVFSALNPQGVHVASFKRPTSEESSHDFLWRIHRAVPARGFIGIFNRSHYEDYLVPAVADSLSSKELDRRLESIGDFERHLAAEGVVILKFFLHISKAEQKERLQARLDDARKRWKFDPADLKARELWPAHMKAYGRALARTSSDHAPWYAIPADRKWYRDWAVARIVRETLDGLGLKHPPAPPGLDKLKIPD